MSADVLLDKLDAVRQVAHGRWRARCPAHDGKNSNVLSIGETSDGTTLVKCFAGCNVSDVVSAVGLELSDLFPRLDWQTTGVHGRVNRTLKKYDADEANHPYLATQRRPRVDWPALITAFELDLLVVHLLLADIAAGKTIPDEDRTTAKTAATRVWTAVQEARNG
jgi:hypothetical protein